MPGVTIDLRHIHELMHVQMLSWGFLWPLCLLQCSRRMVEVSFLGRKDSRHGCQTPNSCPYPAAPTLLPADSLSAPQDMQACHSRFSRIAKPYWYPTEPLWVNRETWSKQPILYYIYTCIIMYLQIYNYSKKVNEQEWKGVQSAISRHLWGVWAVVLKYFTAYAIVHQDLVFVH